MPTRPPVLGQKHQQARRKAFDTLRGSSSARGYDRRWRDFRAAYIAEVVALDPFCQDCHEPFMRMSDIHLHHKKKLANFPELKFDRDNIRHLNKRCHDARTARGE